MTGFEARALPFDRVMAASKTADLNGSYSAPHQPHNTNFSRLALIVFIVILFIVLSFSDLDSDANASESELC